MLDELDSRPTNKFTGEKLECSCAKGDPCVSHKNMANAIPELVQYIRENVKR